jgi:uncharacterized protein
VLPARFVTDSSLDLVARRLRVLGFDVVTLAEGGLEALYRTARREHRTVLTLSRRRPHRHAEVPALVLDRGDPARAMRAVAERHRPTGQPFSRCTICNRPLERRPAAEAAGEIPERVRSLATWLQHCGGCGRWYWRGSHADRLRSWLEEALGRPMAIPAPPGPGESPGG